MTRRAALYLGFGGVIAAALGASYLHLASWLVPWMPPGWGAMSYVAALSIDGLILAPIMARQIVGGPVPGLALPMAQALGIIMSIYVNTRWGIAARAGTIWADIGVGASILPVVAMVAEHAMRATLAAQQAKRATDATPVAAPAKVPRQPRQRIMAAPAPAMQRESVSQPRAQRDTVRARAEAIMAAESVSLRTAYRRLAERRAGGMA